jgi:hypothetical protein
MTATIIYPELATSQRVASISHDAFRAYVHLLMSADDAGRFAANPAVLHPVLFPAGGMTMPELAGRLSELERHGLVTFWTFNNQQIGQIAMARRKGRGRRSRFPDKNGVRDITFVTLEINGAPAKDFVATSVFDRPAIPRATREPSGPSYAPSMRASKSGPKEPRLLDVDRDMTRVKQDERPLFQTFDDFCASSSIPTEYARYLYARFTERREWVVNGKLIDWKARVSRYWLSYGMDWTARIHPAKLREWWPNLSEQQEKVLLSKRQSRTGAAVAQVVQTVQQGGRIPAEVVDMERAQIKSLRRQAAQAAVMQPELARQFNARADALEAALQNATA